MDLSCVDREFYGSPENDDLVNSTSGESNVEEGFYQKSLLPHCQKDRDVLCSWYESSGSNSQDMYRDYRNWQSFSSSSPVNDLSDVLVDNNKLSKETQYLMHLLDDNDALNIATKNYQIEIAQAEACKSFSNMDVSRLSQTIITQQAMNNEESFAPATTYNQAITYQSPVKIHCYNTNEANNLENYPINVQLQSPNYRSMPREHIYAPCHYVKVPSQSPVFYSPTHLQNPNQINQGCIKSPLPQHIGEYKEKTSVREERQKKRREKNRECSRLFRVKQKVKEGNLKRGQCDKEDVLNKLLMEKDRLERALVELSHNGLICSKASTMMSECRQLFNKDNKNKW